MATIIETLEACKVIVDALAVGANKGLSYHPANMVELSNHIAVALEEVCRPTPRPSDADTWLCKKCNRASSNFRVNCFWCGWPR